MRRSKTFVFGAVGIAIAFAVAACGSSGSKANGGSPDEAATGSTAKGTPIEVGVLTGSEGLGVQNLDKVASAATSYLNAKGGVHGRPIKLVTCEDTGTPETVSACANKFVQEKVVVAVEREVLNEAAFLPPMEAAGIPVVVTIPTSAASFKRPVVFAQTAATTEAFALGAVYGKEHNLLSNSLILVNSAAAPALVSSVKPFYQKAGVTFESQLIAPGTADLTAAVTSAIAKKPASLSIFTPLAQCVSALKAAKALGYQGQIFVSPSCSGPVLFQQAGDATNGVIAPAASSFITFSPGEQKTYLDAMNKYAPGVEGRSDPLTALWSEISLTKAVLDTLPTTSDYSAASVLAAFRGLTNFQYPFDGGISLTCNGKQISFVPAACSSLASLGKFQDGKVTSLGNVDYSSVFN